MRKEILQLTRVAYVPRVEDRDGAPKDSKFAGTPYLSDDEEWPACRNCGKPLQLFVQLNSASLPEDLADAYGPGIVQLFYCVSTDPHCESECGPGSPFSECILARRIEPAVTSRVREEPRSLPMWQPRRIVGWEPEADLPHPLELRRLGIKPTGEERDELDARKNPLIGEKLGGWPLWVQDVEYPSCPTCSEPMEMVFQLDSLEKHLPYMFGDVGCGHLVQCRNHKDQLTFGWACT